MVMVMGWEELHHHQYNSMNESLQSCDKCDFVAGENYDIKSMLRMFKMFETRIRALLMPD